MSSLSDEPEEKGVAVLVEFLTSLLESAARAWEQRYRSKQAQDPDLEVRAELRLQLLQIIFLETALIPHLFQLLLGPVAQFESAALLRALLSHALSAHRCLAAFVEPLLGHFLPHVEVLGKLLLRSAPKVAGRPAAKVLHLNAYSVQEPLGALRVAAVQILASLTDLAPERTVEALKPSVWTILVQWFFEHRCNHIFQSACCRLFVAVINFGSVRLQQLVLIKLKLFTGICDVVLAEGACGDRWHEQRPQAPTLAPSAGARIEKSQVGVCRKRHPGGLGGITPVVAALVKVHKAAVEEAVAAAAAANVALYLQKGGTVGEEAGGGLSPGANRSPLAPRTVPQQVVQIAAPPEENLACLKPVVHVPSFIARMLNDSPNWIQVIDAAPLGNARAGGS